MNISFIIITNGKNDKKLLLQIKSIEYQKIDSFEIIIVGILSDKVLEYCKNNPNILLIKDKENANNGSLGALRNKAANASTKDYLVISDDDMLFSLNWYEELKTYYTDSDFEILTPCVKVPDGTRFWDHCCYMSPKHGHIILNPDQEDDHLYMSGGQSWIMKKAVWNKVKWDENLAIYNMKNLADYASNKHNEDTDYSLRCRENNIKILHNPNLLVYHNDATYTSIGRVVRRRQNGADHHWCLDIKLHPNIINDIINVLMKNRADAEAIDLIRKLELDYPTSDASKVLLDIENQMGGKLTNSTFSFNNKEYKDILERIS
jgi:GT2 family glycosyltransferase